jgi:outer membrane biogenesis lipoprotein LolB
MPDEVSRLVYMVLFVAPALQSTAIVLLALLGIAMLVLAACSCIKKNSAVASRILSKSQHLIEKNTGEQLLGRTQYRARLGWKRRSKGPET